MEKIKIILENNCTFNDEFYGEISGTAKGLIFVSTYATLTMGYFEIHICNICELKWYVFSVGIRRLLYKET